MTMLYDWGKWFDVTPPAAEEKAGTGLIPARTVHPAELVNVRFMKVPGDLGGIERIFTFRITSGVYNNREVNYKVKPAKPGKIRPLMDVLIPDPKERGNILVSRDAKLWLKELRGRPATIRVDVFKEWNYICDILK